MKHEISDSFCRLVHSVCALLARRVTGADSLSNCLAFIPAAAPYRYNYGSDIGIHTHFAVSAGPPVGMEERGVSCLMNRPPKINKGEISAFLQK